MSCRRIALNHVQARKGINMIQKVRILEPTGTDPPDRRDIDLRSLTRFLRRELLVLAIAAVALLAIMPLSAEANPEYEAAQDFLDEMAVATVAIRAGEVQAADVTIDRPGLSGLAASPADGTTGTLLVGLHEGRCFLIHWQSPGASGVRAGVLDPAFPCEASSQLIDTLPSPPLVEVFPGTVPPLEADLLLSRVGEARHGAIEPFPAERTAAWFAPAVALIVGLIVWELVGITIKLLRRRRFSRQW
jgi:hypothetical protein